MTDTADVVIVGAGSMGVSTAYHLARLGAGRVIVLERDTVCSGSTALASGGIRHQYANRLGVELTTHSIVTYERFAEEFGVDPHFRQHGYLILIATEEELATARRSVALQQSLGVAVELLDAAATRALCPYLNTGDLLGATYTPRDGEAWLGLAASYDRLKRYELADRAYREALAIFGPRPEVINNIGYSYLLRGDLRRARVKFAEAQAKDPENPTIANNIALVDEAARRRKGLN